MPPDLTGSFGGSVMASPAAMSPAPYMQYYPQTFDDPAIDQTPQSVFGNSGTLDWNVLDPTELQNRQNGTGGYPLGSRDAITTAMLQNAPTGGHYEYPEHGTAVWVQGS